jgi:lactoylglutathione lyase
MTFTFNHVNLNVTDIERSLAFYEKALGLKLIRRHEADDGRFIIAFIGDKTRRVNIELTWLRDKEGAYELGDNEGHLAFTVSDMEAAHRLHSEMGVICFENKEMGLYFIEDPDGYWLEVVPERG